MRVTGGSLKGFHIPAKFSSLVRPTTDMMREAVFNKIQHTIGVSDQSVLDLFAGSGIVSLEFLSRAAGAVISIDKDSQNTKAMLAIKKEKELENWQIERADVFGFLAKCNLKFDIIYADPPYDLKGIQQIPELAIPLLNSDGILLLEHRPGTQFSVTPMELRKHGSTAIAIFAKTN